MKKILIILLAAMLPTMAAWAAGDTEYTTEEYSGMMHGWTLHYAYGNTSELAYANGLIYGMSDGSLFSLDPQDEEVRPINALNGLSGSGIGHIISDEHQRLLIAYSDGAFDVLYPDGTVGTITDLKRKQLSGVSKLAHDIICQGDLAYLACDFGILIVNTRKLEIAEWYQPTESGYPMLTQVHIIGDTLYAVSEKTLYAGRLQDNLVDYAAWKTWRAGERSIDIPGHICGHVRVGGCDYNASVGQGIIRTCDGQQTSFQPNGPAVNFPYRMTFSDGRMIMVPGSRWTSEAAIPARVMILEDGWWSNIQYEEIPLVQGFPYVFDFTRAAIDPQDKDHYFISSYGEGLYEFRGRGGVKIYNIDNSPLISAAGTSKNYCRVDGVAYDKEGYLWMLNATNKKALQVLSPEGQWASISVRNQAIETPGDVLVDQKRPNYRWVVSCRHPAGIGLVDDNGTPMNTQDDRSMFRTEFYDMTGKYVSPTEIYSIAQDRSGAIWIGTKEGLLMLPLSVDFFTSNRCSRIIIKRTDGSGLGDYMLGTEQINSIAVDGGNRLWIGTQASGVYLMDIDLFDYETQTVQHFTKTNSPMPSDVVLSVAVDPLSGEVYIGTDMGLVSFKGDASEPEENYEQAYVYPNPVRPGYDGLLTVTGLMEGSSVKIADAAGHVVYSATANGGTAVWDMLDPSGRRVSPGVYVIFCNSAADADPAGHTALKVLIM